MTLLTENIFTNSSLLSQQTVNQSFVVFYRILLNITFSVIYFFCENGLLINSIPPSPQFSVPVLYTIAARRRVLDKLCGPHVG